MTSSRQIMTNKGHPADKELRTNDKGKGSS